MIRKIDKDRTHTFYLTKLISAKTRQAIFYPSFLPSRLAVCIRQANDGKVPLIAKLLKQKPADSERKYLAEKPIIMNNE